MQPTDPKDPSGAKTLAAQVFNRLQSDLKANRFQPGERLRFQAMTSLYEVGIAPLREALSRLSEAGLVVQVGQKGFRVAEATLTDLMDVIETRRFLEVHAFQEAIRHGDERWESEVVASFHRFSKVARHKPSTPEERAAWEERHTNFHQALIAGCPSRWLQQFWSVVFDHAERYRRLAIEVGHWTEDELKDHEDLMNVAIARDAEKAGELLQHHIGQSSDRLLAQILPVLNGENDSPGKGTKAAKARR
jgi:DNA-binding GntR family transcriptional regulator